MESLGYMLIYLARGSLPWEKLRTQIPDYEQRVKAILAMKEKVNPKDLCEDLPEEFARFFTHVQSLEFYDRPNYSYLRRMFRKLFVRKGFQYDFVYDWTIQLFLISESEKERGIEAQETGD